VRDMAHTFPSSGYRVEVAFRLLLVTRRYMQELEVGEDIRIRWTREGVARFDVIQVEGMPQDPAATCRAAPTIAGVHDFAQVGIPRSFLCAAPGLVEHEGLFRGAR